MRDMTWMPGAQLEEELEMKQNYGNRMPKEAPMFVCTECGGLNKHLRSCSKYSDQCEYCRAPAGYPHHPDCPDE